MRLPHLPDLCAPHHFTRCTLTARCGASFPSPSFHPHLPPHLTTPVLPLTTGPPCRRIDVINRSDAITFLQTEERRAQEAQQRAAQAEAAAAAAKRKGKAALLAPAEDEELLGEGGEGDAMDTR
jgi:hypothetical protein